MQELFQGADGLDVVVEDGGGQGGVGVSLTEDFGEVFGEFCPSGRDYRDRDGVRNCAG